MNPLTEAMPPRVRQIVYLTFVALVVVAGAINAGYSSADLPAPTWLRIAGDVLTYLGGALTLVAASNISSEPEPRRAVEDEQLEDY